jgi:alkylglycerol monooxygenase
MSPILYAIPFFLACIAIELAISHRMGKKVYRFHDAMTSLNIGFISETIRSILKLMTVVVYALVVDQVAVATWDIKHPAVWILAFFMYDFFYYWAHRSGHEVNLLWASHVVHHSSEDFNLSTALRQSWSNQAFYWIFYLPMAIAGIPVTVFVITALISALYQFWSHTQLVGKLGWLDRTFVTPSNHRCHHGRNPYCIDKNYGGTLIIWDRMFGTYTEERDDEPVVYGTLTPLNSWNPLWGNVKNYAGIWHDVRRTSGWSNKLMVVFGQPGWSISGHSNDHSPEAPRDRFETPNNKFLMLYGLVATTAILSLVIDLLMTSTSMTWPSRLAYTAFIIVNTVCLSRLFESRRGAWVIESARVSMMGGAFILGQWFHPLTDTTRALGLMGLATSLVLLILLRQHQNRVQSFVTMESV